jgi:plastocyanin
MILTGWDLKALYAPDVAPEWTILTAAEMETKLPLAQKLFTDTVNGVLVNPTQAYLDGLTFGSLPTSTAVAISVSVAANNAGSGNVYVIDGVQRSSLTLEVGKTYTFTHPTGHPFKFSTTSNGTHEGGSEYTTGVTTSTAGSTVIEVTTNTPTTLYYYCSIHSGMGGTITVSS